MAAGEVPFWDIFGFEVAKVGYQGTVLPILFASYILAKVETFLHKRVHTSLDNLVTPLFSLFATGFLTFTLVGPLTRTLGDMMTNSLVWLYDTTGAVGGAIIGFFYAPLVITGMHHSFIAVETQLLADIAKTGGTFIFPIAAMSNVAQGAAALGAAGLPGVISIKQEDLWFYILGMLIATVVTVTMTYFFSKRDWTKKEA